MMTITGKSDRQAAGSAGYAGFTGHTDEHLSSESKTGSVPGVLRKSGLWKKDYSGGRMDGTTGLAGAREISSTSSEILMEKVREVLERNMKKDSRELILLIRD